MSNTPPLGQILLQLTRSESREAASRALYAWLDGALRKARASGDRAERVRSRVACKLLELVRTGGHTRLEDADRYGLRMVRHALYDAAAEDQRHLGESSFDGERGGPGFDLTGETATAEEKAALEESVAACRERARALLGRAFAEVEVSASPRYRAGLRATFDDLCALALDQAALPALLARAGGHVSEAAQQAAYKRHERMRKRLREATLALASAGRFTRREAEQALGCLALLLRPGPKTRGPGGRRRPRAPGGVQAEADPVLLEPRERSPGDEPEGALRGAA